MIFFFSLRHVHDKQHMKFIWWLGKRVWREFFPRVFVIFSKKTEKKEELLREAYRICVRAEEADSAGCKLPTQK